MAPRLCRSLLILAIGSLAACSSEPQVASQPPTEPAEDGSALPDAGNESVFGDANPPDAAGRSTDAGVAIDAALPVDASPLPVGAWREVSSPTNAWLNGVWSVSRNDAWAVGTGGTVLHWTGAQWATVNAPTSKELRSVWGSSASAVWAVGLDGTVIFWNGVNWTLATSGVAAHLAKVWGVGPSNVWAVGENGTTVHWDGSAWSKVQSANGAAIAAVWGPSANDVWAVGRFGSRQHWDGVKWTEKGGGQVQWTSIWGSGATDIWIGGSAGSYGHTAHSDGSTWSTGVLGNNRIPISISGVARSDAWMLTGYHSGYSPLHHWNGLAWKESTFFPSHPLKSIWARSTDDIWAVGEQGVIARFE